MKVEEITHKNFKVKNHNEFILKLKSFKEKNRLIDNNEDWIENNISPYSLGYVEKDKIIEISIYKIGNGKTSYFIYRWR